MADLDAAFYERADAHIHLSNEQLAGASAGIVSASMMYAAARFNAWLSASGFDNRAAFDEARAETIAYFCEQYRLMLEENLDDYANRYER
jgi:hypothetical protein